MQMTADAAARSAAIADIVIPRDSLTGLGAFLPARNPIEKRLVAIWERILKVVPIGVEDHWYDLGGDSLGAAALFAEIEAAFCKILPLAALLEADTVGKLAALIEKPAVRNEAAPIFNARGKLPPLFCAHGLTGSAEFARRLAMHLEPEQPVVGFQALYRAGEVEPGDTISAMAAEYLEILRRCQSRGPYRLIGWCVGSLIAFEMAQRLLAEGEEIARLILVDPPVRPFQASRFRASEASEVEEALRHLSTIDIDRALREAMMRTFAAILRGSRGYRLRPYPAELVLLCSEANCASLTAETSEWRAAARGRLVAAKIAPTHMSLTNDGMPRLGFHVRRLLAAG